MYACQQNLISNQEILPFLDYLCTEANNLTNCGIYLARQLFFKANYIVGKYDLEKKLKQNLHFQFLYSQAAQQILRNGFLINADLNGAANIIRKANQNVSTQTGFNLSEVCREVLSLPHLYDIFNDLKKSYRKQALKNVVLTRFLKSA